MPTKKVFTIASKTVKEGNALKNKTQLEVRRFLFDVVLEIQLTDEVDKICYSIQFSLHFACPEQ